MSVETRVVLSEEWPTDVGDLHATVRVFENVVVNNFPHGPDCGVALSMDPLAAIQLDEFIDQYRNDLFDPQK